MTEEKATVQTDLKNHLLIAMPGLHDSLFADTVIYLCEHGAMGLVVNQPLDISLSQIFDQFELSYEEEAGSQPVLSGGPVQVDRGFILHRPIEKSWEATLDIAPDIQLTSSRDIISDLAHESGPEDALIVLGYSGWGAGQLERELADNAWLTIPASSEILFDIPFEKRAETAAANIGVDLHQLSSISGHA